MNGSEGRYLLTGLGQCGACGGGMFVHTHGSKGREAPSYGCMAYHTRGRVVCKNGLEVPLEATESAVLAAVEQDLLRVEVLETSLAKALDRLRPAPAVAEARSEKLREDLARLEFEVSRLAAAIAAGGDLSALLTALQEREQRRTRLRAELAALKHAGEGPAMDMGRVLGDLRERLTDWQGLLRQEAPQARQALSALLAGRLVFSPRGEGDSRHYEFTAPGSLSKVVEGLALPKKVVAPG